MSKLKKRAFVRYSKKGLLVPGSLIVTNGSYPNGPSKWFEVPVDLCCTPDKCCSPTPTEPNCSIGGYWFDEITDDQNTYLQSATMDDNCNIYTISTRNSNVAYKKFDSSGNLVWEKYEFIEFLPAGCPNFTASDIKIGPDGNIYVVYENGVRKMDTDGNTVWESHWDNDNCSELIFPYSKFRSLYGVAFDKLGNMFITGDAGNGMIPFTNPPMLLLKLSTSTGVISATKLITITDPSCDNAYLQNSPVVDGENNVIMYIAWYGGSITDPTNPIYYQSTVFKFDNDLNELWNTRLDRNGLPNDGDMTALCIDGNGNVYGNNYGTSIFKLNKDGVLQWTRSLDSVYLPGDFPYLYNLSVTTEGDVYWIGDESCNWISNPELLDPCFGTRLYIFKFDTDGNYQWGTAINNQFGQIYIASWDVANEGSVYKNKTLMVLAYTNAVESIDYLIKHPLTQVTGIHGNLDFQDITSLFSGAILSPATGATLHSIDDIMLSPVNSPFSIGSIASTITNTTL